jgi:hypothetical protein
MTLNVLTIVVAKGSASARSQKFAMDGEDRDKAIDLHAI